jgi:hypothetical protein
MIDREAERTAVQALLANDPTWWQGQRARDDEEEFNRLIDADNA